MISFVWRIWLWCCWYHWKGAFADSLAILNASEIFVISVLYLGEKKKKHFLAYWNDETILSKSGLSQPHYNVNLKIRLILIF